jgi:transposase
MVYVGIDVASDKHDFMIITEHGEVYTKRSVTIMNTDSGYEKLHKSITDFCGVHNDYQVRIGLESTGFYHLNLLFYLLKKEYQVTVINPILTNMFKKSKKVHSPKTDNLDSQSICKYLIDNQKDFKPYTLKSYHTEALKSLSRDRFSIVEELRQVKLDIYRILSQLFPEYLKLFSNIYQGSALAIITKYPSPKKLSKARLETIDSMIHGKCKTTASEVIKAAKASIGNDNEYLSFSLLQAIKTLNFIQSKIDDYDQMIKHYIELIDTKILTIPGVGYTTAGLILGEIGDISRFKNAEHLVSFAGLDIEVYESGKFKATNHRISKKGSKYLRYALYQVAKVCWIHDTTLHTYYEKKLSEHKHFFVIIGHLQKKMVKIIYSILKSGNAYTPR